jgi:putative SbcD/Mre11-related phosphoesterase
MNSIEFQPVPDKPALYLPKKHMLVVADLHIGIENELREFGVHVSSQIENMKQTLFDICEQYHPSDIVLIGDVKHTIPSTPFHEKKELYTFLDNLHSYGKIHIIPGNHDGGILNLIPSHVNIYSSAGTVLKNIGLIHGHRWPTTDIMQSSYVLMGHTHPTILLKDRLGFKTYESCWLRSPVKKEVLFNKYPLAKGTMVFLVLPAFNSLCGGLVVNEDGIIGPLSSILDIDQTDVFLLEGTHLGKVLHLRYH